MSVVQDRQNVNDGEMINPVNIENHLWRFAENQSLLADAAEDLRRCLSDLTLESSITAHAIQSRAKGLKSYKEKSEKVDEGGVRKYKDPATEITDTVAARVIVFTKRDWGRVVELIKGRFLYGENKNPGDEKCNGYDSQHLIITGFRPGYNASRFKNLERHFEKFNGVELQVRTVAGHAWAEYEHDVRYKPEKMESLSDIERARISQLFIEAGGFRKYMDEIFDQIDGIVNPVDEKSAESVVVNEGFDEQPSGTEGAVLPIEASELVAFAANRFPRLESGELVQAEELAHHLARFEIGEVGKLSSLLDGVDSDTVARLMDYPQEVTAVRRLDDDILFAVNGSGEDGDSYIARAESESRRYILSLRQRRVRNRFKIYTLVGVADVEESYTAAGMVRELVRLALSQNSSIEEIVKPPFVTAERGDVRAASLSKRVSAEGGELFVSGAMRREDAEDVMRHLLPILNGLPMQIHRAGDLLFSSNGAVINGT